MPNLYYCQSTNHSLGILRAVLTWDQGRSLLNQHAVHYAGQQFPTTAQDRAADFAVLRIFDEELDEEWRAGFYRFDADNMRIEEAVQACTAKLSAVDVISSVNLPIAVRALGHFGGEMEEQASISFLHPSGCVADSCKCPQPFAPRCPIFLRILGGGRNFKKWPVVIKKLVERNVQSFRYFLKSL
jgi:hypothetical protein